MAVWLLLAIHGCGSDEHEGTGGSAGTGGQTTASSGGTTASSTGGDGSTNTSSAGGTGGSSSGSGGSAGEAETTATSTTGEGGAGAGGEGGSAGAAGAPSERECAIGEACAGYTLIGSPENDAGADFDAFLIDMEGNLVHRWTITGFPPKMLPGGSLVGCSGVYPSSYDCVEMQQQTWDGELEWSFSDWEDFPDLSDRAARHHHDFEREGNPLGFYAPGQDFVAHGNTLVLAHERKTVPEIRDGQIDDDVIYEVDWSGERTEFEWHGSDHFDEFGFDDDAKNDIATRSAGVLELFHGNTLSLVGPNHWYDEGHEEFAPDNIIYSSRQANFVVIIERETGDVVWRIGPDFAGRPEQALGQFAGQHHVHMIPRGLPGAGNILVFDNGGGAGYGGPNNTNRYSRTYSRAVEFDPISFEIVWQYGNATGTEPLRSNILGGVQRLPNGNTLITEGVPGRLLEVTPDKEIVWQYQNDDPPAGSAAWIYRATRVPPEWLPEGVNETSGNYVSWASQFE